LSPTQTPKARQALDNYVSNTSDLLTAAGVAPTEVTNLSNITQLTEGSVIAASARHYAATHASPGAVTDTPFVIVGTPGPIHYSPLNRRMINRFLDTLSENQTPAVIAQNSAVVHGLDTQNVEK
jgi:hypothetical protein